MGTPMGSLGRYLESLFSAPENDIVVADATIRQWEKISDEERTPPRRPPIGRRKTSNEVRYVESTIRTRLHLPDGLRVEEERTSGEKSWRRTVILRGDDWQMEDPAGKRSHGRGGLRKCPHLTPVQRHFDRDLVRQIVLCLRLTERDVTTVEGIECARFHAYPREGALLWPHWLPQGVDYYEMAGDMTRGVLLSIAGVLNDEVHARYEVTQLAYDAPLDPSTLELEPVGDDSVETVERTRRLSSPAVAQARVGFAVFVPKDLPDGETASMDVTLDKLCRTGEETVRLSYRWDESDRSLWINQGTARDRDDSEYEWVELHQPGLDLKISDPGGEGMRILALEKEGTHISITTNLDLEAALKLAASLERCSGAN